MRVHVVQISLPNKRQSGSISILGVVLESRCKHWAFVLYIESLFKTMAPPFRSDQIGSLLRPPELLQARANISSSSQMYEVSSDTRIKEAETKAINDVVQRQLQLDIRPICSGEYCRHM